MDYAILGFGAACFVGGYLMALRTAAAGQSDVIAAISKLESNIVAALHTQTASASRPPMMMPQLPVRPQFDPRKGVSGPIPSGQLNSVETSK